MRIGESRGGVGSTSGAARFGRSNEKHAPSDAERSAELEADPRTRRPDPDEDGSFFGGRK